MKTYYDPSLEPSMMDHKMCFCGEIMAYYPKIFSVTPFLFGALMLLYFFMQYDLSENKVNYYFIAVFII